MLYPERLLPRRVEGDAKKFLSSDIYGMGNFIAYLLECHDLKEVSKLFPTDAMNALFRQEIEKVMPLVDDAKVKADLLGLFNVDAVGYVSRSLATAGFGDEERDALTHDLFVRWLIKPGGLVSKWKMQGPLSYRFKKAVKNAIATLAVRASRRGRRFGAMPDDQVASEDPRDDDDLISDFRQWLARTLGTSAVIVFDARVAGEDIKSLIGTNTDIRSSYALKKLVQSIKATAVRWAGTDPAFQEKVRRLMDAEQETLAKRFGTRLAKS